MTYSNNIVVEDKYGIPGFRGVPELYDFFDFEWT